MPTFDIDDMRRVVAPGEIKTLSDEALNDSDKEFSVPAGKTWEVLAVYVKLISTASAGARHIVITMRDSADKLLSGCAAGATQAASLTYEYSFGVNLPAQVTVVNNMLQAPLAYGRWPAGVKIRVFDIAAIAPAADDMTVNMLYAERDV